MAELSARFRIKAPLRCDGIGRLDCAEDTESGQRMAVRWLPLEANGDAAVKASARLPEHPTLPRIRQTGATADKAFLAMDFPEGNLLSTRLGEALSGELLLEIGAQISDALATVHSQNVFHGELSAESILMVPKGKAYLWDMPLVIANRLSDRRGEERLMHQLTRTVPFLPPERARGAGASAAADVYSLGAVLCLAAGAPMPTGLSTLGVVHALASGTWSPTVPAVFHEPFRSLLLKMLNPDDTQRPTAREVADLLGKPAPAIPTIPEMPAIVLPKDFVLPGNVAHLEAAPAEVVEEAAAADVQELSDTDRELPALQKPVIEAKADDVAPLGTHDTVETPKAEVTTAPVVANPPAPVVVAPDLAALPAWPPEAKADAVALTENVAVAAELAPQAIAMTRDDAAAMQAAQSIRPTVIVAAVVFAMLTAMLGVVIHLARKAPATATVAAPTAAVVAPKAAAPQAMPVVVDNEPAVEDELPPLPNDNRPRTRATRRVRAAAPVKAEAVEAAPANETPAVPEVSNEPVEQYEDADLKRPEL